MPDIFVIDTLRDIVTLRVTEVDAELLAIRVRDIDGELLAIRVMLFDTDTDGD
jgi:hypothetical protein